MLGDVAMFTGGRLSLPGQSSRHDLYLYCKGSAVLS